MLIQNLTDLYDGGPEGWNQKAAWLKRLKNEETKIFNPCINMLACSTPVWLVDSIGRDNLDSGFASRILFVVQKGRPERSFGWKTTPSMKFMRGKLIEDLIEINALQGEFETTQCFRDGFDELDEINKAFIEKNPGHLMLGYYARKLWHVLKLSQVLHCSRSDDMLLTGQVFQEAVTVIEGLEDGMEGAFQKATMSNGAKLLTRVWHYLLSLELGEPLPTENVRAQFIHEEDNDISRVLNQLQVLKKTKTRVHEGKICVEILDPTPLD